MKKSKIIAIISIIFLILILISNITFATINPNNFKPSQIDVTEVQSAVDLGGKIISAITIVGTIVSVVVIMGLGIKYMLGSVEERADYKKTMIPILIGMILIFGLSWIINIIFTLVMATQ